MSDFGNQTSDVGSDQACSEDEAEDIAEDCVLSAAVSKEDVEEGLPLAAQSRL